MSNIDAPNSGNPQHATEVDEKATRDDSNDGSHKILSAKKVAANRRNALRSTGPRNTERTKYNSLKHGFLANGLTRLDDSDEFAAILRDLTSEYSDGSSACAFLIESAARDMIRGRRNPRIEAETIELASIKPRPSNEESSDQGSQMIDPVIMKEYTGPLLDRLQRYETAGLNRVLRCLRQLERMKKDRQKTEEIFATDDNGNIVI
jgi:hypothetical protein